MARLKEKYNEEIAAALKEKFQYDNVMQIPKLVKIVVNMGLGEAIANPKALDAAVGDMTQITGQKPIVTKAKKSVAAFTYYLNLKLVTGYAKLDTCFCNCFTLCFR